MTKILRLILWQKNKMRLIIFYEICCQKLRHILLRLRIPKLIIFFSRIKVFQTHTEYNGKHRNRKKRIYLSPLCIIYFMSLGCKICNNNNNKNNKNSELLCNLKTPQRHWILNPVLLQMLQNFKTISTFKTLHGPNLFHFFN